MKKFINKGINHSITKNTQHVTVLAVIVIWLNSDPDVRDVGFVTEGQQL